MQPDRAEPFSRDWASFETSAFLGRIRANLRPDEKARRKTDKAFLIAKPMRKAAWTKRFAAGWGERGAANGGGELVGSG